jgi:hypothetical protein
MRRNWAAEIENLGLKERSNKIEKNNERKLMKGT